MSQLGYIEPEYVFSSHVSISGIYLDDNHSNFTISSVINRTVKCLDISEKSTSKQGLVGSIDELNFQFELDINKMISGQKYIFDYHGSKYMAIKNVDGDLELSEINIDNE